jgi:hypothetical protein
VCQRATDEGCRGLGKQILKEKHDARVTWEKTLLDSMQRVTNLSSSVENLRIRSDLNEAELEYRRESFNASHSVFVVESKMLDEEIATLRRALARAETKVAPNPCLLYSCQSPGLAGCCNLGGGLLARWDACWGACSDVDERNRRCKPVT